MNGYGDKINNQQDMNPKYFNKLVNVIILKKLVIS